MALSKVSTAMALLACTAFPVAADLSVEVATDEMISNRKAIARELPSGGITAAPISVRRAEGPESKNGDLFEVTVRDAGGQTRLIDRLNLPAGQSLLLTAQNGDAVGLLRYRNSTEGIEKSARAEIMVYLANGQTLLKRVGEFQCQKSASEGAPDLRIQSAIWQSTVRQLLVSIHATCGVISFYGARERELVNISGLPFETALQDHPLREHSSQIVVVFDEDGNLTAAEENTETNQVERECIERVRKTGNYSICGGPDYSMAIWPEANGNVLMGRDCQLARGQFLHAEDYTILACDVTPESDTDEPTNRESRIQFEYRHKGMAKAELFELECSCQLLEVGRLAFSGANRTLSFNVETDALELKLEGRPLQVEAPTAAPQTDVPILQLKFNGNWQITGAGWLAEEASQQSESPAANVSSPAPEILRPN